MDIQRKAFERLPLAKLAIESEYVYYNKETNSYWPNEDFCPSDAPETMNFAWEAWQAAKAQAVPKWTSVEEALPPGNILVLAMAQTFSNVFNVYNVMALDEFQESDITHWMPLPDAPQEPTND